MKKSVLIGFISVCILWIVYGLSFYIPDLSTYSLFPKNIHQWYGIITMHFIHVEIHHLWSNSVPIFVLISLLHHFYQSLFTRVIIGIMLMSGLWVFVAARPNYHLGASALVYGLASFIFFSGIFRKYALLIRISLLVVFLYGSMIWGMFPIYPNMSWEGHLFGALSGLILAFFYRNEGPQRKPFQWEIEEEKEDPIEERYWEQNQSAERL